MTDSTQEATTTAFQDALSQVMGAAEDSPEEQPEVATTDEGEPEPALDAEPDEDEEAEDSEEEQPEAETDEPDEADSDDEGGDEEGEDDGPSMVVNGKKYTVRAIEALEDKAREIQSGVTKKYQKVAETQKQWDARYEELDAHYQLQEEHFKAPLRQFEQLDWQDLKTRDPAGYQQMQQQFQVLEKGYQQAGQARQQLQEKAREAKQAEFLRKAQDAKAVLQDRYSDWSNELYHQALKHAVDKFGAPVEEVEQEVRPWVIAAMVDQMRSEKAQQVQAKPKPQSVKKTIKQKATPKPRSEAQRRADALKSDRSKAARGDRAAQDRVLKAEVRSQLGL